MERAIGVRRVLKPRGFAAVRIPQHGRHFLIGERRILFSRRIGRAENALVQHDLAGAMDAPIGHEHDRVVGGRVVVLPDVRRIGGSRMLAAVEPGLRVEEHLPALHRRQRKPAVAVGGGGRAGGESRRMPTLFLHEGLHAGIGDRVPGGHVDDVSRERLSLPTAAPLRDDRDPAHPHERGLDDVVLLAKVSRMAREHPIAAGLEILRHGHVVPYVGKILRVRHGDRKTLYGRLGEQRLAIGVVEPLPLRLASGHAGHPISLYDPHVCRVDVSRSDPDHGPRRSPHPLRLHDERLRLDLCDQVFTECAAWAPGVGLHALLREIMSLHEFARLASEACEVKPRERGGLVIPGPLDEGLERRFLLLGKVVANRRPARPQNPVEIGGQKRRAVGIGLVKCEQVAIEPGRLDERRTAIGDGRIILRLPGEKLLGRAEGGRISCEFKDVFGLDHAPFARRGEFECVAHNHVPHRGPIGIGHRAGSNERGPLGHGKLLQRRRLGKRRGEPAVNLPHDRGQVPRGDRREVARRRRPRCALGKPPAILLEEAPGPVRLDRLEHGLRLGRCLLDRSGQLHEPLRVVRRPVTRRREHARGDRPGSLGPRLVPRGGLLDAGKRLRGGFRLSLVECLLDLLPDRSPRPGGSVVAPCFAVPHADASQKHHNRGQRGRTTPRSTPDFHTHCPGPPVGRLSRTAKSMRPSVSRTMSPFEKCPRESCHAMRPQSRASVRRNHGDRPLFDTPVRPARAARCRRLRRLLGGRDRGGPGEAHGQVGGRGLARQASGRALERRTRHDGHRQQGRDRWAGP